MTKRKLALAAILLVISAAAVVLALGTSPGSAKSSAAIKAAWIYVGPHNDGGWSQAHDQGRLFVQKSLGSQVQTTYKENVPEGPQVATVIDQLVRDGNKIIFATSFGYQPAVAAAADKYPDVNFEMATGTIIKKNMSEYYGAGEDAIYLSGIAAGAATKSGVVGYVVPFAIPEVIRHTNAFTLGVQKAHPGAKVRIVWTNSWFAPDKEKKAAENLKAAGADVLGQNQDSPSTGQVAKSEGIKWTGYDSDQQRFAPDNWLTGAVYNWGPYYAKRIQAVLDGTWKSASYYGSIADGFTDIAPFGKSVPSSVQDKINAKKDAIKSGAYYEFQGPLMDQTGKQRVPKGSKLSLNDILGMTWFVKGVIGNPKGS